MGMFDKDKEMGLVLTTWVPPREEFVIWSATVVREDFPTSLGPAAQVRLSVSRLSEPGNRYDVTTLASAIVDKVREADAEDFPAIVYWTEVPSRFKSMATVLQFVKAYDPRNRDRPSPDTDADPGPVAPPPDEPGF